MPGDETRQKRSEESDSEEEEEEEETAIPTVDIDISKLHPLSPEVISKQVCVVSEWYKGFRDYDLTICGSIGYCEHRYVSP